MIDAVMSLHANPATCGVAKFNLQLAQRLGVPFADLGTIHRFQHPLVSIKFSESRWSCRPGDGISINQPYDLFLHDSPTSSFDENWIECANTIYAANSQIAEAVSHDRKLTEGKAREVVTVFCPSTLHGRYQHRVGKRVLTFGMAHKIQRGRYEKLKALLDATGKSYMVEMATAVHEGSPWDSVVRVGEEMREIFGDHLWPLGFLSDEALWNVLRHTEIVALFYEPALRANNTSFWAAVEAGHPIITNLDEYSPMPQSRSAVWDIDTLVEMPNALMSMIQYCWKFDYPQHTWDKLLERMGVGVSV